MSAVVSGSIQFGEERIRLTLNLIDAETERQVQSRQLDVDRQGLLGLQNEATRHLARMLDLPLSSRQAARVAHSRAADPEAERLYLGGRGVLRNATSVAGVDAAIELFARALQADSTLALAHAGLGKAYRHLGFVYRRTGDPERAEKIFRKVIARQPECWKGYNALGFFLLPGPLRGRDRSVRARTAACPSHPAS